MEDMTDRTPSSTPVKVVEFLSPSVPQFCSVCGVDILLKYKNLADVRIKLFKDDKKTSDAGKLLERVLDVKLDYATDLPFVCKNCYRSISNHDKKIEENKSTFQNLRNHVRSQYLRTKAKSFQLLSCYVLVAEGKCCNTLLCQLMNLIFH